MNNRNKAILALIVASFFWSSSGVAAKTLLKVFDPISLAAIRLTIASIVILPFFLRVTPKISWKLIADILPVALFSAANFLFFMFGIHKTTANASIMIYTATPLLVAFLSHILIQEHISKRKIFGVLLGLTGVMTILILPAVERTAVLVGDLTGNLLIFGAMVTFSLFTVGSRRLTSVKHYDPITITGISMFVSAVVFLVLLTLTTHVAIIPLLIVPANFLAAAYLAIFVTVVTYILHQWAIKHTSATTGSLTSYIQPVFGFIINGVMLGEVITGGFLVGTVLVFAGITLVASGRMKNIFVRK